MDTAMNRHEMLDLGGGSSAGLLASRASYAPDHLALMFESQRFTYAEFDRKVSEIAGGLLGLGVPRGTPVAIFMSNRPENLFTTIAINRAGLVYLPINTGFKAGFLQYPLEHAQAGIIIVENRLSDALLTVDQMPESVKAIVYLDGIPSRVPKGDFAILAMEDMIAAAPTTAQFPVVKPWDTASIAYTSGTTGRSKGVIGPALMYVMMAKETANAFGVSARDRMYTSMPMFHGMAQVTTCLTAIYAGATIVLSPQFSVSKFWDEVRQSETTQFNTLGSILHMLLGTPASPMDREHCVKRVFAAPAPADALHRFERRFNVHVIEGYGSTEIKNVLYNPIEGRRIGSMGKPTPSSIMEIHDENGYRLPPGQIGEIVYRPRQPHIMAKGYLGDPDATLENARGLWWHTGDMGSMDEDGFFYFFDRKKDFLRRRGENISSFEVETVVQSFPGVKVAAAIAAKSELGEDEVMIVIETDNPSSIDFAALFQHCIANMPRFMVPRYFRAIDKLPYTPTGKVRKVELRQEGMPTGTWDSVAHGMSVPR